MHISKMSTAILPYLCHWKSEPWKIFQRCKLARFEGCIAIGLERQPFRVLQNETLLYAHLSRTNVSWKILMSFVAHFIMWFKVSGGTFCCGESLKSSPPILKLIVCMHRFWIGQFLANFAHLKGNGVTTR